jgi:hypothetical protein
MDKVHKLELLQEIIAKILEDTRAAFGHKQPRMTASGESKRLYQELKPVSECSKDCLCGCRIFGWRLLRLLLGPRQTVNLPANKRAAQHNEIHPCFISQSDPKIVSNTHRLRLSAGAAGPEARTPNHRGELLQCYNHSHSLNQRTRSCVRLDRLFRSRLFDAVHKKLLNAKGRNNITETRRTFVFCAPTISNKPWARK